MFKKPNYIMGDLHLGSRNMFKMVYSKRFSSLDEYHAALIERWNNKVKSKDAIVYILGDIGHKEFFDDVLPKLNGYLILILGNHDTYSKELYEKYFDEVFSSSVWVAPRILLSHVPMPVAEGYLNFHGHTHWVKLLSESHYNMCPEWWDYTPVLFKKLEGYLGKIKRPNIHFMEEWYADIQEWHGGLREELHFVGETKVIDVEPTKQAVFERKYKIKLERLAKLTEDEKINK